MWAFVGRPFGQKNGIDFDKVHSDLIAPALKALKVEGDTTGDVAHAGNIREDMFKLLAVADLVIADLSIHNANVFHELGVRHAVCERRTYLIRAKVDDVPFDLLTHNTLEYNKDEPSASLDALVRGLRATMVPTKSTARLGVCASGQRRPGPATTPAGAAGNRRADGRGGKRRADRPLPGPWDRSGRSSPCGCASHTSARSSVRDDDLVAEGLEAASHPFAIDRGLNQHPGAIFSSRHIADGPMDAHLSIFAHCAG